NGSRHDEYKMLHLAMLALQVEIEAGRLIVRGRRKGRPQKKSAQPQKKAKQPASTNEKAHAKRDREAPRTPVGAKVSKPAVPEQAPDAVSQKALEAAPAAVTSPRADEQPLNDESRGGSLLATAGTAWPVSPIAEGTAGTPAAT